VHLSIRLKIILLIALPIALIYFLIFGFGVYQIQRHLFSDVEKGLQRLTQHYAGIFSGFLNESAQIARSTAAIVEQNPQMTERQLYAQVKSNLRHNRIVYGSAIAFAPTPEYDNELFAPYAYRTSTKTQTIDIADVTDYTSGKWQWWDKAKQAGYPVWTDPYFDKGVGNIVMATYAVPIFYKKGFIGVATVDVQLEILEETVNQGIDAELDLLIITNKGDYVYHPDVKQIMTNSIYKDAEKYKQSELIELAAKMTSGHRGVMQLTGWETQQGQWVAFYPILNTEWSIALRVPEAVVLARVRKQEIQIAAILSFSLFLIILTVWFVSSKITQPLARLSTGVKLVASGDLSAKVRVDSNDEIGLLAQNFTQMAAQLSKREKDIREARSEGFSRIVQGLKGRYLYFCLDQQAQISYVSPSVEGILGYSSTDFQVSFNHSLVKSPLNQLALYKIQQTLKGEQQETFELELLATDNSLLRFEVLVVPVTNESAQIIALEGMAHDITQRKQDEEKFRVLFENSSQANLLYSEQGLLDCNHAFLSLFGYHSKEQVLGSQLSSFTYSLQENGQSSDVLLTRLMEQAQESGCQQYELLFEALDGDVFPAELILTSAIMNEQPVFIGLMHDLTLRKETEKEIIKAKEQAEAASKAKSEFLSNMSHELRTPLNGVLGHVQVLLNDQHINLNQKESLSAIQNSGNHLLTLINDVLDLSKIESGKMEVHLSPVNLSQLIKDIYTMLIPKVTLKELQLELQLDENLPKTISTDATKLRQILINILGNAVKFTHQGSIILTISECYSEQFLKQSERALSFHIKDTGVGIPAEKQSIIFDAFKQAQEGIDIGGTGLGLAISQRLIKEMGGTKIKLESVHGQGSDFSFSLPLTEVYNNSLPSLDARLVHLSNNTEAHKDLLVQLKEKAKISYSNKLTDKEKLKFIELLNQFQAASEMGDIDQLKTIFNIIKEGHFVSKEAEVKILEMINEFDFDGILKIVNHCLEVQN